MISLYKKGDFHLHTTASDGKLSPEEIVTNSKKAGLDIIAITDHDTISGIDSALCQGEKVNIKVIPGIELSTLYNNKSVHILGYFKNTSFISLKFKNFLKEMRSYRAYRAKKIVDNLNKFFNINIPYEKVVKNAHGIITRPHIAQAIIDERYNYSFQDIFKNFIGESCAAYVPNKKLSTLDGIKMLQSLNALVILAHPVLIKEVNIEELIELPFHGIEAIYANNTKEDTNKFIKYAKKYNKIITAGSDFHGKTSQKYKDLKHSNTIGEVFLDEDGINIFLDKLNSV